MHTFIKKHVSEYTYNTKMLIIRSIFGKKVYSKPKLRSPLRDWLNLGS